MNEPAQGPLRLDRFERAIAELAQAMANFMGALEAELRRIEATVAPHSHPPEDRAPAVTGRSAGIDPGEDAAPRPAEPASSRLVQWTAERKAILRETYPAGVPLDEIRARLNAAPGAREVSNKLIGVMAAKFGLRRPEASAPPRPAERWTAERLAAARPMFESGAELGDVAEAVNRLEGDPVTAQHVSLCAAARQWTRAAPKPEPVSTVQAPAPIPPVTPMPTPKATAPGPAAPVAATTPEIIQWAGERGIIVSGRDLPLDAINARRRHLGFPPFVLQHARRGATV